MVSMDEQQQSQQVLATENERVSEDFKGGGAWSFPTFLGKHRMQAAISYLNNQIDIIQEELEELETIGESSMVCEKVISSVESIPDPLLPMLPLDAGWDRWFGGDSHNSRIHKRWI